MKNKKWLNYTLGILLTLVVLTVVAGAGFRAGMMQNITPRITDGAHPSFAHDVRDTSRGTKGDLQDNGIPRDSQRQMPGMGRNFDRQDGGFNFLSPLFGLARLLALGALIWIGYIFIKKSGWRLSISKATTAPAATEPSSVETGEEKQSE